jgi:hypothetical protein
MKYTYVHLVLRMSIVFAMYLVKNYKIYYTQHILEPREYVRPITLGIDFVPQFNLADHSSLHSSIYVLNRS